MIEEMLRDNLMVHIAQEPLWLQGWVYWMMLVNTASLLFLRHTPARWVLAAWAGNIATMSLLYGLVGYERLLGLSHVLWWTPLAVYLFRRRAQFASDAFGIWARVLLVTILASLIVDYVDLLRYVLGDGALTGPAANRF